MTLSIASPSVSQAGLLTTGAESRADRSNALTRSLAVSVRFFAGAGITLGLFVMMIKLIGEPAPFTEIAEPLVYIGWETVRDDPPVESKPEPPVKPPKPVEPPLMREVPEFMGRRW